MHTDGRVHALGLETFDGVGLDGINVAAVPDARADAPGDRQPPAVTRKELRFRHGTQDRLE